MDYSIDNILRERYLLPEENSWSDLAKRVSGLYPDILPYIESKTFVPGSPTLMNACTDGKRVGTLSSCFPMGITDSMDGIMDAMKDAAMVTKMCGGVGYDFSVLRGSNEIVKSAGKPSSGVMGFIYIYNAILEGVRQGSLRRGAGMSLLSCYHPDVLKFINAKSDLKKYNRTNFSVKLDHAFYRHLENNPKKVFKVKNIVDGKENGLKDKDGIVYTYEMVWDNIINMAWKCAEPGIFNESYVSERSTLTHICDTPTANPCLPDFVHLITRNGLRQLKDVNIGDEIWSKDGWVKITNKWSTGIKPVYVYSTRAGEMLATEDHKIVSNNEKIEIGEAESIDTLCGEPARPTLDRQDILDGLMIGDGSRCHHPCKNFSVYLNIGEKDTDYLSYEVASLINGNTYPSEPKYFRVTSTTTHDELVPLPNRIIPDRFFYGGYSKVCGFLRGLYSANGSICGKRVTLKGTCLSLILQAQKMLGFVGIPSYYTINKPSTVKWDNGEYTSKKSYDLNISAIEVFKDKIGFIQKYKNEKLAAVIESRKYIGTRKESYEIVEKTCLGEMEVFDLTVDNVSHTFWCNGFNISNCQEFCTTVPNLSCSLASIDLAKLVENKEFNWEKFGKIIGLATRFLNAVIDKNVYPLKKIEEATLKARAIGLGVMGLAHSFYKLGIPYDSDEAKELTKDIMLYETLRSMKESVEMAKENKPYEWFNYDVFMKANHRLFRRKQIQDINIEQLQEDIKTYGCYNSSQTSIAPTGSISTLAETSSGIEPVFGLVYIRKVETGDKEYSHLLVIDPVFKEHVESKYSEDKDKIYEYVSKHNGTCQGCDYVSKEDQKVFKVASDIEPMRHLDILEATSMKTSLSVSKTINLPSSATPEDISKIYLEAYKRGIIGVTVYRDGCREGILVHETNGNGNGKGIERKDAPKRPENLECDVHRVKVGKDHLVVLAGKMKGKLYEVFVAKTEKELEYETGTIKKVKRNHYDFMVGDKVVIDNLGKNFGGSVERTLARFVSMSLRSGVALTLIVEQLTKGDDFFSFDIAVSRVLKKYIKNGEGYEADVCDVCKSKLIYYDGCIKCSNCTWSKCG